MPGSIVDLKANAVLDRLLGAQTLTVPSNYYAALFAASPTGAGGGTEVTGGSYARTSAIANNLTSFPAAASRAKSNGIVIAFPAPTASWGHVVGMALMDASTAGVMWFYAILDDPRDPAAGDPAPSWAVNTLQFLLPNAA